MKLARSSLRGDARFRPATFPGLVNPIDTLIRRLPLGSKPATPPDPPLASEQDMHAWLHEVSDAHDGVGWRIAGGVPSALGSRLANGEHRTGDSPRDELRALSSGESIDAFTGRVAGPPGGTPSERMLQVAAWTRALSEVLVERAREVGPLVSYRWEDGRWSPAPLPTGAAAPHVGILDGESLWVAESPANRPLVDISMDIGWALSLRRFETIGPSGIGRAELAAVVALDRRSTRGARHVHRTAGLEGPWIGAAVSNRTHQAPPLELISASRLQVDAIELASLTRRVHALADQHLSDLDEDAPRAIARELTRKYGDLWRPRRSWRRPPRSDGREEYVARSVSGPDNPGDLDAFAYAIGVGLQRFRARRGEMSDVSPSYRVPHGTRDVLTAVHFHSDVPETFSSFQTRLNTQRRRESEGFGLLSEWQRRLARQPIGSAGHQRLLGMVEGATRLKGPSVALNGTGELTYSQLTPRRDADFQLYSGTTPPGGPLSSAVAVHAHRVGDTLHITLTARGSFAERSSAAELLDLILEALPRD